MIEKLQEVNCETELKFFENFTNFYHEMGYGRSNTFQYKEDVFSKIAKSICKSYHEVFLFLTFLQLRHRLTV